VTVGQWRNDRTLKILSDSRTGRRRFLVFVVLREDVASSLLSLTTEQRNFDLALRLYAPPGKNESLLSQAEFVMTGGLSKFHAAELFLRDRGLLQAYDGYLFLDGDVEFDASRLSQFLAFVDAVGLQLAQPALTRDSGAYWKMTLQQPGYIYRESSFVEVMAPFISQKALHTLIPTFSQSISGYGLDLVWPRLLQDASIGVVDAFQMRHREKVDHETGRFYTYLKSIGVDLDEEERQLLARYGIQREHAHSRRGYFWKRRLFGQPGSGSLCSVPLPAIESHTDRQLIIDLTMGIAKMQSCRPEPEKEKAVRSLDAEEGLLGFLN